MANNPLRHILLSLSLFGLILGAACGGGESVGSDVTVVEDGTGDGLRLGETTTTEAPPQEAAAPPPTTAPATTAPPQTAPPTTEQQVALTIRIVNRSTYEPTIGKVSRGALVRWVNEDTIPRQVAATDNAFVSPKIPPGGSWEWKATAPGDHPYADPDVPFAAGARLQVSK